MRVNAQKARLFTFAVISIWNGLPAFGNDSAASVGVGGIQLAREARISMEKERLTISREKITVEYEFLNDTGQDITTEVAFPVPPHEMDFVSASFPKGLDDFRVWVEGRETKYQVDAKAMLNGVDYSSLLRKLGVDVASFGHFTDNDPKHPDPYSPDLEKLTRSQRDELNRLGLVGRDNGFTGWAVVKIYHWRQTFPARKILRVRHEYAPILGFELMQPEVIFPVPRREKTPEFVKAIRDSCIDAGLQNTLIAAARRESPNAGGYFESEWVDYILTTANTWKTPIKDFELIVERPRPSPAGAHGKWFLSFCWNGPVKQLDSNRFVARSVNFVPNRELHVGFFGLD